jgi:hypothetical protein
MAKKTKKRRAWTATEVRELKSLAKKKTAAAKIAKRLKRSEGATRQKAFSIGLSLDNTGGLDQGVGDKGQRTMLPQGYRETFYTYSGKASDICRQLAFAAIAVIWIFKTDTGGRLTIPTDLVLPGTLVVLSLALDLMQYCLGTVIWYFFYRHHEKLRTPEDHEIKHSLWLDGPIHLVFWLKVLCVLIAYFLILRFCSDRSTSSHTRRAIYHRDCYGCHYSRLCTRGL